MIWRLVDRLLSFVVPPRTVARTTGPVLPAGTGPRPQASPPPGFEAADGTRTVPAGTACPVPATSHGRGQMPVFFRHPDPFKDDCHYGSADMEAFPPTAVELALAMDVLDGGDDADPHELWKVCQSVPRLQAVKQAARQVRASDAMMARLK